MKNLPNQLTMFRIILVPFFVIFMLFNLGMDMRISRGIALGIFCVASLTDFLDGYIARKYNLVSNFGKFMDPLADKILVSAAMICLCVIDEAFVTLPAWVVIIIIAREFAITGFRTLAAEQNVIMAAGVWGKLKTISQMVMIIFLIFNLIVKNDSNLFDTISYILIFASTVLAVFSGVDYIVKNRNVLK